MIFIFIELWTGLRDLYHDNKTTASKDNAKRFINWSISDIGNEYDWEFLRKSTTVTPSADIEYNLNPITQPSISANLFVIASASADNGVEIKVFGSEINNSLDAITYKDASISISAGVSASSNNWANIDYISKPETTGTVFITDGTNIICTLDPTDTYKANNVRKINKVVDPATNRKVEPIDWSTQLEGSPNGATSLQGYDFVGNSKVRFFGVTGNQYSLIYQMRPRWLVNNYDVTEFPRELYQDIVQYAYRIYGKQYQDDATQTGDTMVDDLKKILIGNIIRKWTNSSEKISIRVLPRGYTRAV